MSGRRAPNRTQTQPSDRSGTAARGRRRPVSTTGEPVLPDVYQEMLRESGIGVRVAKQKRRKVEKGGDEIIDTAWPTAPEPAVASSSKPVQEQGEKPGEKPGLVEEAGEELDDSDDDDNEVDWEDVDLTTVTVLEPKLAESAVLEVTLNDPSEMKRSTIERRKITAVDRKIRLEVHKLHLLCLMAHVSRRNRWCNNKQVQVILIYFHYTVVSRLICSGKPLASIPRWHPNLQFESGPTTLPVRTKYKVLERSHRS